MGICRLGDPKIQVSTFIHYQDMEIFNLSVFLTVHIFSNQLFLNFNWLKKEMDKLRTVGMFAISQLVCERRIFFFNSVLTVYNLFSTFLHLKICQKLYNKDSLVLFP